jgi:hypothetical protein
MERPADGPFVRSCQTGRVSGPEQSTAAPGRAGDPDALAALAALGPFFAVDRHDATTPPTGRWRSMAELTRSGGVLDARIRRVRRALAVRGGRSPERIELRASVSVAHLGLIARLVAPALGAAALGAPLPLVTTHLWWQDELGGPYPLSVARGSVVDPAGSAGDAAGDPQVRGSAVEAVTQACLAGYSVSPRVLWGNVASAANSALTMIALARPDLGDRARAAADRLLSDERVEDGRLRAGPGFRRRSCCLIYRLTTSTAAVCGDCVLAAASRA